MLRGRGQDGSMKHMDGVVFVSWWYMCTQQLARRSGGVVVGVVLCVGMWSEWFGSVVVVLVGLLV